MRWGRVLADQAGQVMADGMEGVELRFISLGRLTLIWETKRVSE